VLVDISDTAFLVAYERALESDRPRPTIWDPHARALAGERGRRAFEGLRGGSVETWPVAVRTRIYDEMVIDAVREHEVDTILSLGAGLDARPYRLALPRGLCWIDVDVPAVLEHKSRVLSSVQPACSVEPCALDLLNAADRTRLLERIAREPARVLVLTEGFLGYLEEESVATIASELRSHGAIHLWAAEFMSPVVRAHQRLLFGDGEDNGVAFKFAPEKGSEFFTDHGWHPLRKWDLFDEGGRLGRAPALTPEWRATLRGCASFVLLERIPARSS
jgi:methyltransferase (TIGR00027 family)